MSSTTPSPRRTLVLYASRPGRAARQLIGDACAVLLAVLAVRGGRWVDERVSRLQAAGDQLERAGDGFRGGLSDAGRQVGRLPGVGDDLRRPFDAAAGAGTDVAEAGRSWSDGIGQLAFWLGVAVAAAPLLVVAWWALRRIRWVRRASAARALLHAGADASLFALRALATQPLPRLAALGRRLDVDPAEAWRRGDPTAVAALAGLELEGIGLR